MFRHLLLPLDLTDLDRDPLECDPLDQAIELALLCEGRITLFHVVEAIEGAELDDPEMRAFYRRLKQRAKRALEPPRERCLGRGITCDIEVRVGHRVAAILERAATPEIDLVVMSSRPMRELPSGSWPTISFQISMASPVPVLLLR